MAKVCQKDKNVKQESSPVNSPIGMRAEEKLEAKTVVQTRKEELEEYLQGVELHLETVRKSLETAEEVESLPAEEVGQEKVVVPEKTANDELEEVNYLDIPSRYASILQPNQPTETVKEVILEEGDTRRSR